MILSYVLLLTAPAIGAYSIVKSKDFSEKEKTVLSILLGLAAMGTIIEYEIRRSKEQLMTTSNTEIELPEEFSDMSPDDVRDLMARYKESLKY